jgi:hypothetical protein
MTDAGRRIADHLLSPASALGARETCTVGSASAAWFEGTLDCGDLVVMGDDLVVGFVGSLPDEAGACLMAGDADQDSSSVEWGLCEPD